MSATIFGLAALEDPRVFDNSKSNNIAFDAQFWLAPGITLVALLRYYNSKGNIFDPVGKYIVCATVSLAHFNHLGKLKLRIGPFYRLQKHMMVRS